MYISYKFELNLRQEIISKYINHIALLLKENGFYIKDKKVVEKQDIKEEMDDYFSRGEKYIKSFAKYIFIKKDNNDIEVEVSGLYVKLNMKEIDIKNITNQYDIFIKLLDFIKKIDKENNYYVTINKMLINYYTHNVVNSVREIKKLVKEEGMHNKYTIYKKDIPMNLKSDFDIILDDYGLYIHKEMTSNCRSGDDLCFLFTKHTTIYVEENNSLYNEQTFNDNLVIKLTEKLKEIG